jgi:general transcription factor 3C polypeptide 3 (transcription factor C subunit 4)
MGVNEDGEDKVLGYFDLYRQIADTFHAAGLYQRALEFYGPLKEVPEENTGDLYVQMGYCFQAEKRQAAAEECFQTAIQLDEQNVEARMQLAKMYESLNEQEQAFIYVNEVMSIQNGQNAQSLKKRKRGPRKAKADEPQSEQSKEVSQQPSDDEDLASVNQHKHKRRRLADPKGKLEEETSRAEQLQLQYRTLRSRRVEMLNGNRQAARAWMAAARDLTDDFRAVRSFYPFEKHLRFLGYRATEYHAGADIALDDEATAMAERLSQRLFPPFLSAQAH